MSKHILFVLDYYYPHRGGSENVFENIINRLIKKNYKISIITSKFSNKILSYEQKGNLTIYRTGKNRFFFIIKSIFLGIKILNKNIKDTKDEKDSKINIIHTSTYGGAIPTFILSKIFNKKTIITVHEIFGNLRYLYKGKIKGFIYKIFEQFIFLLNFDKYHCVSYYTMNSIRTNYGIKDSKMEVIYNGVDKDFWDKKNVSDQEILEFKSKNGFEGRFVVLYFGHTGKSKGLDFLINAIPDIISQNSDVLMVFNLIKAQRDGIIKQVLLNQSNKLNNKGEYYDNYIEIFGGFSKKDLRLLVASSDVVVAPSLSEGFGSVHTETVAMDTPLITTFVGPLPEVLRGKVKFIKPQSAKAITHAIKDIRMGKIDTIPNKSFSRDNTTNSLEKIYIKLFNL